MRFASLCDLLPAMVVAAVLFAVSPSRAGLLSNATLTRDTETGLDWVDLTLTDGQILVNVVNDPESIFPGSRVATADEARSLFAAVGLAPDIEFSLAAFVAVDTLHTFLGTLNTFDNGVRIERNSVGVVSDVGPSGGADRVAFRMRTDVFPFTGEFSGTLREEEKSLSGATGDTGVFLVLNVANGTSVAPLAASSVDPLTGALTFSSAAGDGIWFDLGGTSEPGVFLRSDGNALFTHVGLPSNFSDVDDQVMVADPTLGDIFLGPGDTHEFSVPVDSFSLLGIGTSGGPTPVTGANFPVMLRFDAAIGDFTAATVPEPSTLTLALFGLVGMFLQSCRRTRRPPTVN